MRYVIYDSKTLVRYAFCDSVEEAHDKFQEIRRIRTYLEGPYQAEDFVSSLTWSSKWRYEVLIMGGPLVVLALCLVMPAYVFW